MYALPVAEAVRVHLSGAVKGCVLVVEGGPEGDVIIDGEQNSFVVTPSDEGPTASRFIRVVRDQEVKSESTDPLLWKVLKAVVTLDVALGEASRYLPSLDHPELTVSAPAISP